MSIDRRVQNAMDPETKIVHIRLELWSEWATEGLRGFPESTIIDRIMKQGAQGASSDHSRRTEMPDPILITDRAVAKLKELPKRCICEYYLRWEPKEIIARRVGMNWNRLQVTLRDARTRIACYIEIMEEEFEEDFK